MEFRASWANHAPFLFRRVCCNTAENGKRLTTKHTTDRVPTSLKLLEGFGFKILGQPSRITATLPACKQEWLGCKPKIASNRIPEL